MWKKSVLGVCAASTLAACTSSSPKSPTSEPEAPDAVEDSGTPAVDGPTWHQDIAPVVHASCVGCHADGALAFDLTDPEQARALAESMATAVESRAMPPWGQAEDSCTPPHGFQNDIRLSDDELALFRAWADVGAPLGNPDTAADLHVPEPATLADADQTLAPEVPYVTEGLADEFICFVLDPELDDTRWLTGLEVVPGNAEVVHHALVYTDPTGQGARRANDDGWYPCFGSPGFDNTSLVGAWAPGAPPIESPEGSGTRLEAGTGLVVQVHYHPQGDAAAPDQTAIRLRWTDTEPALRSELLLIGNQSSRDEGLRPGPNDRTDNPEFRIPAETAGHTETMVSPLNWWVRGDISVYLVASHMHYIGTDMTIEVTDGADDDSPECLLGTPHYDFEWQRFYTYDAPVSELPTITRNQYLRLTCTYDNTLDHPGTRAAMADAGLDAPVDVYLGDEALDEMCIAVIGAVY